MRKVTTEIVEGSGNVFADLGLPDPGEMLLRSRIVIELRKLIEARKLTRTAAAKLLGVNQADLSKLLHGQLRAYSVERMMRMLTVFDQDIEITMRPHDKAGEGGQITFKPAAV